MVVTVHKNDDLPKGAAALPSGSPVPDRLRLGCTSLPCRSVGTAPEGELHLSADLWDGLSCGCSGLRLQTRNAPDGALELGPSIAVLYCGRADEPSRRDLAERAQLYYGHLCRTPGFLAFGFDRSTDWDRNLMEGYVLDNRPGHEGGLMAARFPIPSVVRLAWDIPAQSIRHLRALTGQRTFNWMRNIGKWQFHTLLSADPRFRAYLPDTRLYRGPADLAAMLVRYPTIFVKRALGIKGIGSLRIQLCDTELETAHMEKKQLKTVRHCDIAEADELVRTVVGPGRAVVQQGLPIIGRHGLALDFRVMVIRTPSSHWQVAFTFANVAGNSKQVFTNLANGARDEDALESLMRHLGMTPAQSRLCLRRMEELCLDAAELLAGSFDPLGILGFDVAVDSTIQHLWLLEANSVPGWAYSLPIKQRLARSQIDYGLSLTGF